ncbi:hypothetical protein A4R35_17215 [Thermogemmatispora tikiterensis]|uniref:Uncharacterized protein n=1 Tax=Thermogemmatispora tikiterensis TaxID=1825093 RepID=A0A328VM24_9CHLR|nr:hypothetical protein A4R35_17215 [Thermogemmatispora tikiterensis]
MEAGPERSTAKACTRTRKRSKRRIAPEARLEQRETACYLTGCCSGEWDRAAEATTVTAGSATQPAR